MLNTLGNKFGHEKLGLYRDDGLACFNGTNGSESDRIRIFQQFGFKITISTNLKIVNFLDVTFNLTTSTYQPYNKPNDQPIYINTKSNHPPNVIKAIPESISRRISSISSNKTIFEKAAPYYNKALTSSGFSENIQFKEDAIQSNQATRKRARNIIWYNPPYSMNVETNIGKRFLNLVSTHFPKGHKMHKLFNRNNVKISYSCMPNIASIIQSHNKQVISNKPDNTGLKCNCHRKENCHRKKNCPMDGKCLIRNLVYNANVRENQRDDGPNYHGVTENSFKDRLYKHRNSFKYESKANSTELSKYIWELKKTW